MTLWNVLLRLWAVLTLVSLAIDGACVWIDAHGSAQPVLDAWGVNYITLFLWSAPAPFVLAILLPVVGVCGAVLASIMRLGARRDRTPLIERRPPRQYGAAARKDAA